MPENAVTLIACHGRCGKSKPPVLFCPADLKALRKAEETGARCRPVCRQCRIDRANKSGPYADPDSPVTRRKGPSGYGFRRDSASLCPGSAQAVDRWITQTQANANPQVQTKSEGVA